MAKYYGDIAKTAKDLLSGGFNYDHKFAFDTKAAGTGVSGSVTQKGEAVSGDIKVNATVADQVLDIELNQDAKAKVTATFPSVVPNGKLSVGGTVQDLESFKLSTSVLAGPFGIKADVINYAAPKCEASVCYALGSGVAVGATTTLKAASPLAYTIAAQSKQGDITYALTAADQLKTFKISAVAGLDNKQTVGAEVTVKKTATASIGYSKKMDSHSLKAVVSNPVAPEFAPTLSIQACLGNLIPKTNATLCAQVDKTMKYKYGVQFSTKL
ncbi:Eukaryotic porin/Tom40 [Ostreococcus tauri]|uniref:Eukaryotic porin/Tom40 n=1 Tax=Ostreococcus tauri TaxID=70448 RepID=A0A090N4C4_OSTTA|nr:Eukaryotic porin/Tom40 [Ostreococcus tauri]CEF99623.1 Eukaryotic porin/Tom40 [Ostreococcus tauri]|eukprot:XP_022839940.1 Eukaryotic porin/Tom40 [Ostreococcus tauri]